MKQPRATTPRNLSVATQRSLSAYAIAATAAGVGTLALAPPANAEIAYTPVHIKIPAEFQATQGLKLDLNGDGIADFELVNSTFGHGGAQWVKPGKSNHVLGAGTYASALASQVTIGPNSPFQNATLMARWIDSSGSISIRGPWANTRDRYLGFKFLIKGEYHYGWARLTVKNNDEFLSGYAYETGANIAIKAGQESGEDNEATNISPANSAVPTPSATLGRLAQGAAGLVAWHREGIDVVA
jgi:hypothetical protein